MSLSWLRAVAKDQNTEVRRRGRQPGMRVVSLTTHYGHGRKGWSASLVTFLHLTGIDANS
jgi:hypothetical protein